jgi:hypothetical protein
MLPVNHPAIRLCPGFHNNNVFKGDYSLKIVDIFNISEQNTSIDNLGFHIPKYSIDGKNKPIIPYLNHFLEKSVQK